jgi:hypothetical protein
MSFSERMFELNILFLTQSGFSCESSFKKGLTVRAFLSASFTSVIHSHLASSSVSLA